MRRNHNKTSNIAIRVPSSMHEALIDYSRRNGVSCSEVIRQLLGDLLEVDHNLKIIPCVIEKKKRD